ncbi:dipeptidyl peptidase 9-like isoform X1 [Branchiostoma floridae x Branchiostoma belcheri]
MASSEQLSPEQLSTAAERASPAQLSFSSSLSSPLSPGQPPPFSPVDPQLYERDYPRLKSWGELRQAVRSTRRLQTNLANRVPHNFTFAKLETEQGTRTRLYFLGVPENLKENSLMFVDVPNDQNGEVSMLPWQPLLDSFHATPYMCQYSREEQLLRERKRVSAFGITSYDVDIEHRRFLFPASNSLYMCTDDNMTVSTSPYQKPVIRASWSFYGQKEACVSLHQEQAVVPEEIKSQCTAARIDPKICPSNNSLVGFVCSGDLWITNLGDEEERRLTFVHKGLSNLAEDPKTAGVPSFVVQEEFDRYTGYWWSPTFDQNSDGSRTYRLMYEEVDESEVEILHIVSSTNNERGVDHFRYPRAGTANATSTLKMLEITVDSSGKIKDTVVERHLREPLQELFPHMEYLVRVDWLPDGKKVWVQLLSRNQQWLILALLPLEFFSPTTSDTPTNSHGEAASPPVYLLLEEHSRIWVNIHELIYFFPQTRPDEVSFIWANEGTGFRHLYHVTASLSPEQAQMGMEVETGGAGAQDITHKAVQRCGLREIRQLTGGHWVVIGKPDMLWVDETRQLVYFMATKDTPLEEHLYVVSYMDPGEPVRLTELGYYHQVWMSQDCSMYVSVFSSVDTGPACMVYRVANQASRLIAKLLEHPILPVDYHPPELFQYRSLSGYDHYGYMYKPHNCAPGRKYPTLLFVYGGPQVQLVTNSFKGIRFLRLHTLASLGYAVVVLDGRGSNHRGLQFEGHLRGRMGSVEIEDQVEGLYWLAENVDYIDLNRVAIHGWSYGGYLSLMGLAQRPDVFKVAIAGAPVTCWSAYDTGYTERYMGTPSANVHGYSEGSVLRHASHFPEEENRLLIVHGLIDENVHFYHTSILINALVKACKPYQLQVYPNERHGIRQQDTCEHYETMVLSYLQKHL